MRRPTNETQPLKEFHRVSAAAAGRIRRRGNSLVLTVKGKARFVLQDARDYQLMLDAVDYADAVRGIRQGIADVESGKARSLAKFDASFRRTNKLAPRR